MKPTLDMKPGCRGTWLARLVLWAVFASSAIAIVPGYSQSAVPTIPDKLSDLRGEWMRAGAGFACKVAVPEKLQSAAIEPDVLSRACQHIGPFLVGDDDGVVAKMLGSPYRKLKQPNGQTAWIYFLEQPDHYPYLIVTVAANHVVALQVTGRAAVKGYGFNHVDLGMPMEMLLHEFGQPGHVGASEEKGTELWTYGPWPFSFEVRDGHISSIRINKPS